MREQSPDTAVRFLNRFKLNMPSYKRIVQDTAKIQFPTPQNIHLKHQ